MAQTCILQCRNDLPHHTTFPGHTTECISVVDDWNTTVVHHFEGGVHIKAVTLHMIRVWFMRETKNPRAPNDAYLRCARNESQMVISETPQYSVHSLNGSADKKEVKWQHHTL